MNRRKFMAECQEFKEWLKEQVAGGDADLILLKVLILLWRGHLPAETVVARSVELSSLRTAVWNCSFPETVIEVPQRISDLLIRWACSLPRDIWFLGEVYEKMTVGRRAQGLFYTAPEIIDFIMLHTVESVDIVSNPYIKILDPACGCGYFLLKAYDVLWRKYTQNRTGLFERFPGQDWSDSGIHRHIVGQNLWGADIDPVAVDLAAAGLLLKKPDESGFIEPNLLVCDSLRRPGEDAASLDRVFWSSAYDFVVGNPPYLSFGLRGAGRLDSDYERYLREAFKGSAEYKLSYYVLFMERGIEMLAEGGKLGFIVPDSFLLGRYYSKIRRYILQHTAIEVLAQIMLPVFKQASVGMSAVCVLTKESDLKARACKTVCVYQAEEKGDLQRNTKCLCYSQGYFESLPYNRFRIFSDLTVKNLVDTIENNGVPLVNFASGHSGIRSVTRQSDIIAESSGGATWRRGLVSGSQVHRYGLEYRGHWLSIDSKLLYKGGWDPAVVTQRKILIRQTGYTLTACIDDNGFYHLNNVHSFVLKNGVISLDYLLLLLNSRLMSFYYHAVTMEYGRAMAQTDIESLELLPVMVQAEANAQAPRLVAMMQVLLARQIAGEENLCDRIAALDDLLNQVVYRVYALNDEDIACIERYEARLAASHRRNRRAAALI